MTLLKSLWYGNPKYEMFYIKPVIAFRLEVCKHLMVDLKDRVICDVKHGDRCNPYCKDRMRVYKAHPDSKTDG